MMLMTMASRATSSLQGARLARLLSCGPASRLTYPVRPDCAFQNQCLVLARPCIMDPVHVVALAGVQASHQQYLKTCCQRVEARSQSLCLCVQCCSFSVLLILLQTWCWTGHSHLQMAAAVMRLYLAA